MNNLSHHLKNLTDHQANIALHFLAGYLGHKCDAEIMDVIKEAFEQATTYAREAEKAA